MSYIGRGLQSGAFRQLDDISSGFDGSDTTHTMQVNSTNVTVGDVNQILLSLGGVIQKPGTDFTVSGSVLTFTTAPAANTSFFAILLGSDNGGTVTPTDASVTASKLSSDIAITTTGASNFNNNVTISTADNTDTLTLKSTDADAAVGPVLTLHRESSSPADDDIIGRINFIGEDSGGTDTTYGRIETVIMQESNGSEDATMEFRIMKAGTERNVLELDRNAVIINEDSVDLDFRVESNGKTHALFVDGGNDKVGIINSTPNSFESGYNDLVIGDTDTHHGLTIVAGTTSQSDIGFADGTSGDAKYRGFVVYQHQTDKLLLGASGATRVKVLGGNNITVDVDSGATTDTTAALQLDKGDETHSSSTRMIGFIVGGQGRGFILNGTSDSGSPSFGAGSDRRLKKNITAYTGGYDKIKSIPVQTWDEQFTDTTGVRGWIADELEKVFPEAVTGTKDATKTVTNAIISEHGNFLKENVTEEEFEELKSKGRYTNCTWSASKVVPAFQLSMPDKLFPDVVQALQAAMAKIETLEADVKTLKGE